MKNSKDHLDIDMEFLDKKEPLRVAPKPDSSSSSSVATGPKYKWKKILIIGGVVLFFVWIIYAGSNDSTVGSDSTRSSGSTAVQPSNNNQTSTGNNTSSTSKSSSNSGTIAVGEYKCSSSYASELDRQETETNRLKNEIDTSYVNEYSSQSQINQYNAKIDKYNALTTAYNNYLKTNCTPSR